MYKNRRKTGDREEETLTKTPTEKTQRGERERSKIGKRKCMISSLSLSLTGSEVGESCAGGEDANIRTTSKTGRSSS